MRIRNMCINFCLTINWCHENNFRFLIRLLVPHLKHLVKKYESFLTILSQFPLFNNNHKTNFYML